MLLEVQPSAEASIGSFICTVSVQARVRYAIEHVARVHGLRGRLAAAMARTDGGEGSVPPGKRTRDAEALAEANALLSPLSVSRKNVLTIERLEAALAALCDPGTAEASTPADLLSAPAAGLFFAGKWLEGDKLMSEYVGTNDKSKVKVVFGASGALPTSAADSTASAPADSTASAPAAAAAPAEDGPASSSPGEAPATAAAARDMSLIAYFKQQQRGGAEDDDDYAHRPGVVEPAVDENEELPQLSARQAELLVASRDVRHAIADPRLQELLRRIDSAPTREGALRRLEHALGDADFEAFTRTALREIGARGPEEGPG